MVTHPVESFFKCLTSVAFDAMLLGRLDYFLGGRNMDQMTKLEAGDNDIMIRFELGAVLDLIRSRHEMESMGWNREIIRELLRDHMGAHPAVCRLAGSCMRGYTISVREIYKATGVWVFPGPADGVLSAK